MSDVGICFFRIVSFGFLCDRSFIQTLICPTFPFSVPTFILFFNI